jgi:hypothetical protein
MRAAERGGQGFHGLGFRAGGRRSQGRPPIETEGDLPSHPVDFHAERAVAGGSPASIAARSSSTNSRTCRSIAARLPAARLRIAIVGRREATGRAHRAISAAGGHSTPSDTASPTHRRSTRTLVPASSSGVQPAGSSCMTRLSDGSTRKRAPSRERPSTGSRPVERSRAAGPSASIATRSSMRRSKRAPRDAAARPAEQAASAAGIQVGGITPRSAAVDESREARARRGAIRRSPSAHPAGSGGPVASAPVSSGP